MLNFMTQAFHVTSGYRDRFVNFQMIPLKPITAADKHSFNAIGKGDMYINVLNGAMTS